MGVEDLGRLMNDPERKEDFWDHLDVQSTMQAIALYEEWPDPFGMLVDRPKVGRGEKVEDERRVFANMWELGGRDHEGVPMTRDGAPMRVMLVSCGIQTELIVQGRPIDPEHAERIDRYLADRDLLHPNPAAAVADAARVVKLALMVGMRFDDEPSHYLPRLSGM